MVKNKESTRYYSNMQEQSVCKLLDGRQQSNSGAGDFNKGDVVLKDASMLIECKTCVSDKESFSIKKEWFSKNAAEAFAIRLRNHCVCFNFGPQQPNYFIINEKLMKYLVEKIKEDNSNG